MGFLFPILFGLGGAFIGSAFGYAAAGYLLGSYLGQLLAPKETIKGPRLNELQIQTSTIGQPIPIVIGTYGLAGNIIWTSGLIETRHKHEQGGIFGIGSQKSYTYTYSISVAVGIQEPMTEAGIDGIRRAWYGPLCVYDTRPQQDDESAADYADRLALSSQTASKWTLYRGTETQMPDPLIEAYEGVGNVSGYRGLAYLVIEELELSEKFGNQLPNIRIEPYTGSSAPASAPVYSPGQLYPWRLTSTNPSDSRQRYQYKHFGGGGTTGDTLQEWMAANHPGLNINDWYGYKIEGHTNPGHTNYPYEAIPGGYEGVSIYPQFTYNSAALPVFTSIPYSNITLLYEFIGDMRVVYWTGEGGSSHQVSGQWLSTGEVFNIGVDYTGMFGAPVTSGFWPFDPSPPWAAYRQNTTLHLERRPDPLDTANDPNYVEVANAPGFYVNVNTGAVTPGITWSYLSSGTYKVLQSVAPWNGGAHDWGGLTVTKYPVGPILRNDDPNYNEEAYWTAAYAAALAAGEPIASGLVYGVDYPDVQNFAWVGTVEGEQVETLCIPMAEAVAFICRRCNLDPATQLDTGDLNSCLPGYCIGSQMNGRDALTPLMAYGLFDAVESGTVIKFVERGHAAVATFTADELAAHQSGSDPPSLIETTHTLAISLPRRLTLQYASPDRDYETSEQAASRTSTRARAIADVQLAISMEDDNAAQLAEIMLYEAHAAQNTYTGSVGDRRLLLEPTDCVIAPVDGQLERMRILTADYATAGVLKFEMVRDHADGYVSTSVPGTPSTSPGGAGSSGDGVICPSESILLDLPAVLPQFNDAGYHWAVRSLCDAFDCARLLRSDDGGTTYKTLVEVASESTIGTVTSTSTGGYEIHLDSGDALVNATDAQLDAGVNLAAIGADGRWHLFQYGTATYDTGDVWVLSDLREGLFGTAAFAASVADGDRFVLLSTTTRIAETPAACGVEKLFKTQSCGENADDLDAFAFTTECRSYVPGAPPNSIISATETVAPDDAANDDAYLIPCAGVDTGPWPGHEGELARWSDQANGWVYLTPPTGTVFYVEDVGQYLTYLGPCDASDGGTGPPPWVPGTIVIADEGVPLGLFGDLTQIDFVGPGVTASIDSSGKLTVDVSGGGGTSTGGLAALDIYDEGVLAGSATSLDFVGGAVTADVDSSGAGTVTIRGVPRIATGATTATLAVCDKCYGATGNITIPSATFQEGDIFSVVCEQSSSITLIQGSGLTLYLAGSTSTGNRVLAARGMATIWFASASVAYVIGQGLS